VEDGIIQTEKEKNLPLLTILSGNGLLDFVTNPPASDRVLGEQEQEFVLAVDGLVNAFAEVVTRLKIMKGKPARDILFAKIGMKSLSNGFVLARIANKEGLILDRSRRE
jgi:hypothetical protein